MTADAAVQGIRSVDPVGEIGLFSVESDLPYNRPPLSKALWKGEPVDTIWRKHDGPVRTLSSPAFLLLRLFELGYEAVGELDSRLQTFADWKLPNKEGVIYYLQDGRVRGVLLWNVWRQVDAARVLIAEPGPFDANNLKGRLK